MPSRSFRLHDAMERMEAGEDLYMGFSTDFAEKNKQLRDDIEAELSKLNAFGPMFKDSKEYYSHAFLYYGAPLEPKHVQAEANLS